jgi:deoxycytidine triphosphate deaminase
MILSGNEIQKFGLVLGATYEQYQPHGIDLRLDKVFYPVKRPYGMKIREDNYEEFPIGTMEKDSYYIPEGTAVLFKILETIDLTPKKINSLAIGITEEMFREAFTDREIPYVLKNFVGMIYPKSSLTRRGVFVHSAVWDSGYKGSGYLLVRTTECPLVIKPGDAFCQMIFFEGSPTETEYGGQYQHENVGKL